MELIVGKRYVTREGNVATVLSTGLTSPYSVAIVVMADGKDYLDRVRLNGRFSDHEICGLDLVREESL